MGVLRKVLALLGIDGAISYTILGKGVAVITTIFTVFFLARFLSPEEQGYYYTFASITAIQIFFELGLNGILTQFVAHEASYLVLTNNNTLEGDVERRSRLSSLLHFCAKWYLIFAALLLLALLITGVFFFKKFSDIDVDVTWRMPWILLAIATAFNFLMAPVNAFLQGVGKVKEIELIRFLQQLVIPIMVWGGLAIGLKLFVSCLNVFTIVIVNIIMFRCLSFDKILINIWNDLGDSKVEYLKEVFPYQWKIALSWISGYFIFQLFNPIIFAVEGSVSAGKIGMTISAASAIQAVLLSWINTKVPRFSGLIEQKQYVDLDQLFNRTLKQILFIGLVLFLLFVVLISSMQHYYLGQTFYQLGERFSSTTVLVVLSFAIIMQVPITAWATYLRCHLQEPFLINSIVLGVISLFFIPFSARFGGSLGVSICYFVIQIISLIWSFSIFKTKRSEWHK